MHCIKVLEQTELERSLTLSLTYLGEKEYPFQLEVSYTDFWGDSYSDKCGIYKNLEVAQEAFDLYIKDFRKEQEKIAELERRSRKKNRPKYHLVERLIGWFK